MEMPLVGYNIKNLSKKVVDSKYFDDRDKRLITSTKIQTCLKSILEKHGYKFNFIFIEDYNKNETLPSNVEIYPDAINFIKTSSSGDALTCWMQLHTLAHALYDVPSKKAELYKNIQIIKKEYDLTQHEFNSLFTFRSARESKKNYLSPNYVSVKPKYTVEDVDELIHELLVDYLWNNKIRYDVNHPYINNLPPLTKNKTPLVEPLKEFIALATKNIIKVLDASVGKIIVD